MSMDDQPTLAEIRERDPRELGLEELVTGLRRTRADISRLSELHTAMLVELPKRIDEAAQAEQVMVASSRYPLSVQRSLGYEYNWQTSPSWISTNDSVTEFEFTTVNAEGGHIYLVNDEDGSRVVITLENDFNPVTFDFNDQAEEAS